MKIQRMLPCAEGGTVVEVGEDAELIFHDYDLEDDVIAVEMGFEKSPCLHLAEEWEHSGVAVFLAHFELPGEVWIAILAQWARELSWTYRDVLEAVMADEGSRQTLTLAPFSALQMAHKVLYQGGSATEDEIKYLVSDVMDDAKATDEVYHDNRLIIRDGWEVPNQVIVAAEAFCKGVAHLVRFILYPKVFEDLSARRRVALKLLEGEQALSYMQVEQEEPETPWQSRQLQVMGRQRQRENALIGQAVQVAAGWQEE